MEKLNLPDFDQPLPPPRVLSMDDFAKWVEFGLQHVVSKEAFAKQQKERIPTDIPFQLK